MKRFVISLITLGLIGIAASAGAAVIINTCTSTYQISTYPETLSGWDSVVITTDTSPSIVITKSVKNLRSGVESNYMVPALLGDTVEFTIVWFNYGGTADTITLVDYLPSSLTYETSSLTDTEVNCDTTTYGTATYDDVQRKIEYMTNTVTGSGNGNGVIRFRAKVD